MPAGTTRAFPMPTKKTKKRIILTIFAGLLLCVVFALGSLAGLYGLVRLKLFSLAPGEAGAVFHRVAMQRGIPRKWRNPQPYPPETLQAYYAFLERAGQAEKEIQAIAASAAASSAEADADLTNYRTDPCYEAMDDILAETMRGKLSEDRIATMALCTTSYAPALEALERLVGMPGFTPDIERYPIRPRIEAYLGSCIRRMPVWLWHTAHDNVSRAVESALNVYDGFQQAIPETVRPYHCDNSMAEAIDPLYPIIRCYGNEELALSALARLEGIPPPPKTPQSDEDAVLNWAFSDHITDLREMKRSGFPVDLHADSALIELPALLAQTIPKYETWAQGRFPADHLPKYEALDSYYSGALKPPGNVLRFLYRKNYGAWSLYSHELHYLSVGIVEWDFGHLFPVGNTSVVARHRGPPVDMRRVNYDLARLNLGAYLYHEQTGHWPVEPADVGVFFTTPISDPGPRGPYIWLPDEERFELREPVESFGIL